MTVRTDAAKNPQHYRFPTTCFSALIRGASPQGALTPGAGIALQLVSALAICVVASASFAQTSAPVSMSMPTVSRVKSPGWWPTKGDATRDSFVGTATCARCHAYKNATQQKHAMARAAVMSAPPSAHLPMCLPWRERYGFILFLPGRRPTVRNRRILYNVLRGGYNCAHPWH
jgi:hypothetical protein